jgi:asparagine synthase (glutamine-hydrolysing)
MHHDLRVYLPYLLHDEDRASMAMSIESRVPLLDYRLVDYLATVPPLQKVPGLVPKALLRGVARPLLPASIVDRNDKTPFASPERYWLHDGRIPMMRAMLAEERTLDRGIFLADDLRGGAVDLHGQFMAFNLELWFRLFIDRDPHWLARVKRPENLALPNVRVGMGS